MQCLSGSLFCRRIPFRSLGAQRLQILHNALRLTKADGREDRKDEVEAHHLPAQRIILSIAICLSVCLSICLSVYL